MEKTINRNAINKSHHKIHNHRKLTVKCTYYTIKLTSVQKAEIFSVINF